MTCDCFFFLERKLEIRRGCTLEFEGWDCDEQPWLKTKHEILAPRGGVRHSEFKTTLLK